MISNLLRLRRVLAAAAAVALTATSMQAASVSVIQDDIDDNLPGLIQFGEPIKTLKPFEIQMDGQGNFTGYYMNMWPHRFVDFHFWWQEPIDPPLTDGGPFFVCHDSDPNHANFKKCWGGRGIDPNVNFGVYISGFRPNESIVVWPTVPLPMPALLLMSGLALTGVAGLRRRKSS